jgi:hypothetical protein
MNDSTIIRVHWLELYWAPRDADRVRDVADPLSKPVVPHSAPMTNVYLNAFGVPIPGLQDTVEKKLKVFEGLAVVSDQRIAFCSKNLELTTAFGLNFLDLRDEAEVTKHRIQNLLGFHFALRVNNYGLSITFAFCNLGMLWRFDKRGVHLISSQVHLGHKKEVLHRPV